MFDDRSGAVLRDRSGKGNHGAISGASWGAARTGSGLTFNGSSYYVRIPTKSMLDFTTALTLIALIKVGAIGAEQNIMGKYAYTPDIGYMLRIRADNKFNLALGDGSIHGPNSTTLAVVGSWYYLAGTFVSPNIKIYVNGTLEGTTSYGGPATANSTQDLYLGRRSDAGNLFFNGVIKQVLAYNRALTAAEIKRIVESELMLVRH
jgi:hypothetical protein